MSDNNFIEAVSVKLLCEALHKRKNGAQLLELEMAKCGLTDETVIMLAKLISSKYKLRQLNLRSNGITD